MREIRKWNSLKFSSHFIPFHHEPVVESRGLHPQEGFIITPDDDDAAPQSSQTRSLGTGENGWIERTVDSACLNMIRTTQWDDVPCNQHHMDPTLMILSFSLHRHFHQDQDPSEEQKACMQRISWMPENAFAPPPETHRMGSSWCDEDPDDLCYEGSKKKSSHQSTMIKWAAMMMIMINMLMSRSLAIRIKGEKRETSPQFKRWRIISSFPFLCRASSLFPSFQTRIPGPGIISES